MPISKGIRELAKKLFPMDKASRMSRAKEMGFDPEKIFIHESPNTEKINEINNTGRFGGLFSLEGERAGYYPNTQEFLVKGDVATNSSLSDYISDNYNEAANWVKSNYDNISSDEVNDILNYAATEDYPSDPERMMEILGSFDEADLAADAQKLRGELAKKAGYNAVTITDEFGEEATTMLLPGSGVRSIDADFDPKNINSSNLMASLLPVGIGIGAISGGNKASAEDIQRLRLAEEMVPGNYVFYPGDVGSIDAVQGNPQYIELAKILSKYSNTPIGPLLGGTADLLEKIGYGEKRTYPDYLNASLDYF